MKQQNLIDQETAVNFGDGVNVSMQTVQHIYNKITGKTEQISKSFEHPHFATFEDVVELHLRIQQVCEQYNIISANCYVEQFTTDSQKVTYSSFDRFKLYEKGSPVATENLRIKYSFMIILPQTSEPQSYVIDLNIHSRASILDRSGREVGMPSSIWSMMATSTGSLRISFIDYAVAKNFFRVVEDWFQGLEASKARNVVNFFQKYSTHAPAFFMVAVSSIYLFGTYTSISNSLAGNELSPSDLLKTVVIIFGGAMVLWGVGREIGRLFERYIDRIMPVSALRLTKGDERMLNKQRSDNRWNLIAALGSILIALIVNVLSSVVAHWMGI